MYGSEGLWRGCSDTQHMTFLPLLVRCDVMSHEFDVDTFNACAFLDD